MTIREWLASLQLEQYADSFERNEVTPDILTELDHEILKELGVDVIGHRLKLLKGRPDPENSDSGPDSPVGATDQAIAGDELSSEARRPPADAALVDAEDIAERRRITVMFCDLVGSTRLSEALDPEDLRDLMSAYQAACGQVIERYDGHVAQYLGDGLMVYFGWPVAHEDDAVRAVRSALEIAQAVPALDAPVELQVKIGISTGPVVVGATGSGDASVAKAAVGETPNVASRMQDFAGPGEVIISPTTHALSADSFDYEDLGPRAVKGIREAMQVYQVLAVAEGLDPFAATRGGQTGVLVGRDEEISLLLQRWTLAQEAEGQIVLVSGEAGIGKTRMARATIEQLGNSFGRRLSFQASPYHGNTALFPIIDQLQRDTFSRGDTPAEKVAKIRALLGERASDESVFLLCSLLGLSSTCDTPALDLSPLQLRERTLEMLVAETVARAEPNAPLVVLLEDLHWCDPTTLDFLDRLVAAVVSLPVLVVLTHRLEYSPPWSAPHVSRVALNRMGKRQAFDLVGVVAGDQDIPHDIAYAIVEKSDGVPLYIEELTRNVLDQGALTLETGLTVPATLHEALMARLDRLDHQKYVAQVAAAIGREFTEEVIAGVVRLSSERLQAALETLADAQVLYRRGHQYVFRHALLQDSAYESLLRSRRLDVHAAIARTLEDVDAENFSELARHWRLAGDELKAARYLHQQSFYEFGLGLAGTNALEIGLRAAEILGVALPRQPAAVVSAVQEDVAEIGRLMADRTPADQLEQPSANDARIEFAIQVLVDIGPFAHQLAELDLFDLLGTRALLLTLRHGNTPAAPAVYTLYGTILQRRHQEAAESERWTRLGVDLDAANGNQMLSVVGFEHTWFVAHLSAPFEECLTFAQRGIESGIASGNVVFESFNRCSTVVFSREAGLPLGELVRDATLGIEAINDRVSNAVHFLRTQRQLAQALRGSTRTRLSMTDDYVDEAEQLLPILETEYSNQSGWYCVEKIKQHVLFGAYDAAIVWVDRALALRESFGAQIAELDLLEFGAMALLQMEDARGPELAAELHDLASKNPLNLRHRSLLLSGCAQRSPEVLGAALALAEASGRIHRIAFAHDWLVRMGEVSHREAAAEAYRAWDAPALASAVHARSPDA